MALLYRKTVRDAIQGVLGANGTGFNALVAASAADYGVTPVEIDWTGASGNFAMSKIGMETLEESALINLDPLSACLFTDSMADSGLPRGVTFSGEVSATLRLFLRPREGAEGFDTESLMDCIEDAAITALNAAIWPIGQAISVIYARQTSANRSEIHQLSDGFMQMCEIRIPFKVTSR